MVAEGLSGEPRYHVQSVVYSTGGSAGPSSDARSARKALVTGLVSSKTLTTNWIVSGSSNVTQEEEGEEGSSGSGSACACARASAFPAGVAGEPSSVAPGRASSPSCSGLGVGSAAAFKDAPIALSVSTSRNEKLASMALSPRTLTRLCLGGSALAR